MTTTHMSAENGRTTFGAEALAAMLESLLGVAVVVLAALSLAGVLPLILTPIAGILFGCAVGAAAIGAASRQSPLAADMAEPAPSQLQLAAGATVDLACGLIAAVLGAVALGGVLPAMLMGVLVIVAGVGLVLSVGAVHSLGRVEGARSGSAPQARAITRSAISGAAALQAVAGLAAIALGVAALVGLGYPLELVMIALLALGGAEILSGAAISARMLKLYAHA